MRAITQAKRLIPLLPLLLAGASALSAATTFYTNLTNFTTAAGGNPQSFGFATTTIPISNATGFTMNGINFVGTTSNGGYWLAITPPNGYFNDYNRVNAPSLQGPAVSSTFYNFTNGVLTITMPPGGVSAFAVTVFNVLTGDTTGAGTDTVNMTVNGATGSVVAPQLTGLGFIGFTSTTPVNTVTMKGSTTEEFMDLVTVYYVLAPPAVSSVVNNASFALPGTVSPGSIASVFANGLGTTSNALSVFPATTSEGVKVTFSGTAAPLFHVLGAANPQQIDLYVPTNLPTSGAVNVLLSTTSTTFESYTLTMAPSNPGFYRVVDPKVPTLVNVIAQFAGSAWLALPVSTTANLSLPACSSSLSVLSTCGQPAMAGDTLVLYATGLGLATPGGNPNGTPLATGQIPPVDGSILYETPTTPAVTIGGIPAKVLYSGLAPGFPGEYQIDVTVPSGVPAGDSVPVVLSILGASDSSTTISIHPRSN
jgi:uncharacterized protein (TIGR03437 family)